MKRSPHNRNRIMTAPARTRAERAFQDRYGEAPAALVRAPGRVNLIGEHTDYNDGFVLPLAIDRAVWIALRSRPDRRVRLVALDLREEEAAFALDGLDPDARGEASVPAWAEYVRGVAWALAEADAHALGGWEGVIASDVPVGAGLSSSAALEVAAARAFAHVAGAAWDPAAAARLAQRAENAWVGVDCGVMDMLASACGAEGHALLIDCRALDVETVPLPDGTAVVVLDSGTRRELAGSAYNRRRAECEAAARALGVPALRDATRENLENAGFENVSFEEVELEGLKGDGLEGAAVRRRARHVITENARTLQAADALREGATGAVGRLMAESHASLRDDFEVSTPALDALVAAAAAHPACHGARMTGAGFGGCAVALAEADAAEAFAEATAARYADATGNEPAAYVCRASAGAAVVNP